MKNAEHYEKAIKNLHIEIKRDIIESLDNLISKFNSLYEVDNISMRCEFDEIDDLYPLYIKYDDIEYSFRVEEFNKKVFYVEDQGHDSLEVVNLLKDDFKDLDYKISVAINHFKVKDFEYNSKKNNIEIDTLISI